MAVSTPTHSSRAVLLTASLDLDLDLDLDPPPTPTGSQQHRSESGRLSWRGGGQALPGDHSMGLGAARLVGLWGPLALVADSRGWLLGSMHW